MKVACTHCEKVATNRYDGKWIALWIEPEPFTVWPELDWFCGPGCVASRMERLMGDVVSARCKSSTRLPSGISVECGGDRGHEGPHYKEHVENGVPYRWNWHAADEVTFP